MNKLEAARSWAIAHYDYLTGGSAGITTGFIFLPHFLANLLSTLLLCVLTGFAGAFGAHLFKKGLEFFVRLTKHKPNG